jgi:hypothetical protein
MGLILYMMSDSLREVSNARNTIAANDSTHTWLSQHQTDVAQLSSLLRGP